MSRGKESLRSPLWLLLSLDGRRLSSAARRPSLTIVLAFALPAALVLSALWTLGRAGVPAIDGVAGGATLGMLVSGLVAFIGYGILFTAADTGFVRQLGVGATPVFIERSLRLGCAAMSAAAALAVPFAAAGHPIATPLWIGIGAAAVAAGGTGLVYAGAARLSTDSQATRVLSIGIRQWDPELAKAAALVYAPLLPFLTGAAYGGVVGAAGDAAWLLSALGLALGAAALLAGARLYSRAAPRFVPRVHEMSYAPPPEAEGEPFRLGAGLTAMLPWRAAAIWVRDATVAGRRFAWASRVTWPVAILSIVVLARWGGADAAHVWVLAAVGLALVVQGAAVVGLGTLEREGPRWIDRSGGLAWWERFLGRWAWAWGLSLWLLIPVGLAWWWWSGLPGGWLWPVAGLATAAVATVASLLNAERR